MNVEKVEVTLASSLSVIGNDRLRAFVTLYLKGPLGNFILRDLKVIDGRSGLFVAMPSRKIRSRCPSCDGRNEVLAKFCNWCGARQEVVSDEDRTLKVHADVFHPLDVESRDALEKIVLSEFRRQSRGGSDDAGAVEEAGGEAGDR